MSRPSLREGMGANSRENGLPSRVWARHTDAVFVIGSFNDWAEDAAAMTHANLPDAKPGDEYRYLVRMLWPRFS
jgi:1,4-alpha-glucan branching enzyme